MELATVQSNMPARPTLHVMAPLIRRIWSKRSKQPPCRQTVLRQRRREADRGKEADARWVVRLPCGRRLPGGRLSHHPRFKLIANQLEVGVARWRTRGGRSPA